MIATAVEIDKMHWESWPSHPVINDAMVQWKLLLSAPRTASADMSISPPGSSPAGSCRSIAMPSARPIKGYAGRAG